MTTNEEYIKKNKVDIIDDDKNTQLHFAAASGCVSRIEKILKGKHKIDPENYMGWTPLMMAVRNGNQIAVNFLLQSGADATRKNKFGFSVFLMSVTSGNLNIVETILEHVFCGGVSRQSLQQVLSPVSLAILFKQNNIFRYLLQRNFDPDTATPLTGITSLMFAAAIGNQKIISSLIQHNAEINKRNYLGKTMSDIVTSRNKNIRSTYLQSESSVPMIIVSSYNSESPHFQMISYAPEKRSSNSTPSAIRTPELSPVTPHPMPYMFFGSHFTPTQFTTCTANDFLNITIYE